jgi:hypothetical protein
VNWPVREYCLSLHGKGSGVTEPGYDFELTHICTFVTSDYRACAPSPLFLPRPSSFIRIPDSYCRFSSFHTFTMSIDCSEDIASLGALSATLTLPAHSNLKNLSFLAVSHQGSINQHRWQILYYPSNHPQDAAFLVLPLLPWVMNRISHR